MSIQRIPQSPLILLSNDRSILTFDTSIAKPTPVLKLEDAPADPRARSFTMLAYRQTEKSAAKGGRANANCFRFRHLSMRAIARTFRGMPFVSGHNWSDVRARGGTLVDAWAEEVAGAKDELGFYATAELAAEWAIEGFANGTIDRFSIGASGEGEITCTVHDIPVWTDCYCWPGRDVEGLLAEWEYESASGKEISAVNVPAVDGTHVVNTPSGGRAGRVSAENLHATPTGSKLEALAALCGRVIPTDPKRTTVDLGAGPSGGFKPRPAAITMASPHAHATPTRGDLMDRNLICASLGLPLTATDEEIKARLAALAVAEAERDTVRAENDAQHVETEITRLRATHVVSDKVVAQLRTTATSDNGRAAFDVQLALVSETAPKITAATIVPPAGAGKPALQSDAKPADAIAADADDDGPDALEQHKGNPNLRRYMKWAQITPENVRAHGARAITVVSNLAELDAATQLREARGA